MRVKLKYAKSRLWNIKKVKNAKWLLEIQKIFHGTDYIEYLRASISTFAQSDLNSVNTAEYNAI